MDTAKQIAALDKDAIQRVNALALQAGMPVIQTIPQQIAAGLKAARESAGLTQAAAGKALKLSHRTVQDWECGRRCPAVAMLPRIAAAYGVKPLKLLRGLFPG